MDSIERSNPSSTKQGSANPVGAYAELVKNIKWNLKCHKLARPNQLIWQVCAGSYNHVDASFHGYVCHPTCCPGMLMLGHSTYWHGILVQWHPNSLTHKSGWNASLNIFKLWSVLVTFLTQADDVQPFEPPGAYLWNTCKHNNTVISLLSIYMSILVRIIYMTFKVDGTHKSTT